MRQNTYKVTVYDRFFHKDFTREFEARRKGDAMHEAQEYYAKELGDFPENMIVKHVELVGAFKS